jgi:competence ComEA-like helix-hairpin-helix protein
VVQRTLERGEVYPSFAPRQININTVTEEVLASHPYMSPKIARMIITYRFQHGNFSSIEDLHKIYSFEPKTFDRIKPYLTLE